MGGLLGSMSRELAESRIDRSIEVIQAALERPKLSGLNYGDKLLQKKFGADYRYKGSENEVIFIRYIHPEEKPLLEKSGGEFRDDIIIAVGVDSKDGELLTFSAESTFFEVVK